MVDLSATSILVVDDDDRVRGLLAAILAANGCRVWEARAGLDALARVREHPRDGKPDLIVLDAELPELDGFEVCRRFKADPDTASIPLLMLSGVYREIDDKVRALDEGCDAFLTKPVTAPELLGTVRAMLRMSRAERQTEERRRSEDALRQRAAQAKSMVEVARAITSSLDLQAVLERIVDQACELLAAKRFALAVLETDTSEPTIRFAAVRGLSMRFHELRPLHWRDGTTPAAIAERRPVWSADLLTDPAFTLTPSTRRAVEAEGVSRGAVGAARRG
jgi:DNA-binding response OmpR family regulator